ncbi:thioredoxin domain-containing protein [Pseudomarimonas arenosa]|uniref:thioredoxin domain-containing protein n=1 Tax=Pseudomarimonas arenosa TaxID=2774145 RepID=UPI002FC2A655
MPLGLYSAVGWAAESTVDWVREEPKAFAQAREEKRLVLLYLEAVWCHWCHVMDERTYRDEKVRQLISEHYVPLRIDQDGRPDLAARYRDVGWPATVVFDADGREILKRQGFVPPEPMARLLQAVVDDPSPEAASRVLADVVSSGSEAPEAATLNESLRQRLIARHERSVDMQRGGLKMAQRYLDRDSVEYSLRQAALGDDVEAQRAKVSLDAALALLDPAWGGFYQYSTGGDWRHPHFEKLTAIQADYLRIYALAWSLTGDRRYRQAVEQVIAYLERFMLSAEGGYFASQDADLKPGEHAADFFALDDAARMALGVPRIAEQRYTRETALVAEALAIWYEISGERSALDRARAACVWVLAVRSRPEGGFLHLSQDDTTPYLADQLAAMRAFTQMYKVTAERSWLKEAGIAAKTIEQHLRASSGYLAAPRGSSVIAPVAPIDESIALARALNRLLRYSADPLHQAMAEHAMRHLSRPEVALARFTEIGIVLADEERQVAPLHLTVVGGKQDPEAQALFAAAMRQPAADKRLDWWDPAEGPLPNPDIRYPSLSRAAAFVCNEGRCSTPLHEAGEIADFLRSLDQESRPISQ